MLAPIFMLAFASQCELAEQSRPSVTLCMMVKDETKVIEETLLNLLPYIDRYDITDTGSTDGTPTLIRALMQRQNVPGTVYHTHWNGFGDHAGERGSRTVTLENCYGKADYLFVMDADDLVVGSLVWPETMDKDAYSILLQHESGNLGSQYLRKMVLSGSIRWRSIGVLHEYTHAPLPYTSDVLKGDYYILSRRLSKRNDDNRKYERDALVLENALISEPDNARYQFYLAQSYRDAGQLQHSVDAYLKRAEMGGWKEEIFYSLYQVAVIKQHLNASLSDIQEQYLRAYTSHPRRAEPLHALSKLFRSAQEPAVAYLYASAAVKLTPEANFLFYTEYAYNEGALDEVCATAWYAEAFSEGLNACEQLTPNERILKNIKLYKEKLAKS